MLIPNFYNSNLFNMNTNFSLQNFTVVLKKQQWFAKTLACLVAICFVIVTNAQDKKLWLTAGANQSNTRFAEKENKISPSNVSQLTPKWVFTTDGDVSATPVSDGDYVYFPDWGPIGSDNIATSNGSLYKVNAATGALVWKKAMTSYTGQVKAFARASPAIAGNTLIIGTQLGFPFIGAHVLGIDKNTGNLLWKTKVEDFAFSIITQSAMVDGDKAYVGVASLEENFAADPSYPCCSFRGSVLALDVKTGAILWKTYTVPAGKGFSGNAVWGSTPVVDKKRGSLYITTGNNYTVPPAANACNVPGATPEQVRACVMAVDGSAQNYFDALMSLDLNSGAIKWVTNVIPFDAWTVACFFDGPNCPDNAGPDYDFGQGPALFTSGKGSNKRELLGAGQKSGIYWAVDPDNGAIVWQTQVGPGGTLGGLQWGSAVDGDRIYTAISNNGYVPHTMTTGPGTGITVNGGFWAALDASTGQRLWENAGTNPPVPIPGFPPAPPGSVAVNTGMVTVANGVVYAGATDAQGTYNAFDAATGVRLWSFPSGGSVNSGAAVVDGVVYWGSGYSNFGLGAPNNKLYAFDVPKKNASAAAGENLDMITSADAEVINTRVMIYPTLTKNFVRINAEGIRLVRVYDLYGKLVKQVNTNNVNFYNLQLGDVRSGTYLVNVATAKGSKTTKVTVIK